MSAPEPQLSELEMLRASQERYRAFVVNSSEGIWCFELDEPCPVGLSEDEQIEHLYCFGFLAECNDALARMYGYEVAGEILGARLGEVLVRTEAVNLETLRAFIRTGYRLQDAESRRTDRQGHGRVFLNNLVGTVQHGCLRRAWGTQRDITELKRVEAELRVRMEELAEADRHKSEFLTMVAHELRNTLAPMFNALEVMRQRSPEDASLSWSVEMLERQTYNMGRLVEDLLDVSRIARGKADLRRQWIELGTLVERAASTSRPYIDAQRHQLTVVLPREPLWLEADPVRLEQVLVNLLNNAAKFMEPGGRIWCSAERRAGEAVLRVRDLGIGIPPEMQARIFDLFVQGDPSRARGQSGLGIGLTLVRHLVEMHGGHVEVHSEGLGRGSEFVVRLPLPLEPTPARPPAPAEPVGAPMRPLRILLVDDNHDSVASLERVLRHWGHEVRTVHDGIAALHASTELEPEVVLLDIAMPGMDGFEVVRCLRQRPELLTTLIIALTGYGQEDDRHRTREAGFDLHLTKPVELGALRRLLAARSRQVHGS